MDLPERGDLVWMLFSPQAGSEQGGRRPGIVLSPRLFHEYSRLAIVCPITNTNRGIPFHLPVPISSSLTGLSRMSR